jgi:DNA-binding NarL/FixJ family response regulator
MDDPEWAGYARLQPLADSDTLNDRAWGTDDLLTDCLTLISLHHALPSEKTLDGMLANRRAKHLHRRRLLLQHPDFAKYPQTDPRQALEARRQLRKISTGLAETELRILVDLAMGYTYAEIAEAMRIPVGTVKSLAHRARLKLDVN